MTKIKIAPRVETTLPECLHTDTFPGCCGISVAYDFPDIRDIEVEAASYGDNDRPATRAEIIAEMKHIFGYPINHLNLISLTDCQLRQGWLSIVKAVGFRRLVRFRNGTGNIVTLFGHVKTDGVPAYKGKKEGWRID